MRSFRSILFACAHVLSACMGVVAALAAPVVQMVVMGFDAMACGVQKLKRELVHNFGEVPMVMTGVGAGLTPEGHGFRQSSASYIGAEERTALSI